ncbi:MAG: HD domain-containing protein [Candidatus Omnitrophica bacterium]|nr:HD domain-containing protein [Candidatus Omnitrophota bacterium]
MNNIFLFLIIGFVIGFALALILFAKKIKAADKQQVNLSSKIRMADLPESSTMSKLEKKMWYEEEIAFIFRVIEEISLNLNKDEIAKHIVQEVRKFLDIEQCLLILLDERTDELKIKYAVGVEEDIVKNTFLKKGESVSGWVIGNNQPLVVNNLDEETWFKKINKEDYLRSSFISVPLSVENVALGVIVGCNKRTDEVFTKEDLNFLTYIAKVGAIAFQDVRLYEQMQENYLKTVTALAAAIDAKDHYTKRHSENVTRHSLIIAKQMNCNLAEIETIRHAGLLHDIGKIGIKDEILLKPGKLTPEEFEQIRLHPLKGEAIVKSLSFLKDVSILIRHHHERYDGKGYPDGIQGHSIERGAKILAVADYFDALNSDRPYRKRLSVKEIIEELKRNQGTQFDPQVIDVFLKILQENPQITEHL